MGLKILEIRYLCLCQLQLLRAEFWQSLGLSVPLVVIQLSEASVSFVDTIMMGRLGSQTLAAGGLGAIFFLTILSICMGMVEGVGAIAAEAYGRADSKGVSQITAQGLWLCLPVSLVGMLLLWQIEAILPWLGQTEPNIQLATEYIHAVVWSFPAALGLAVCKEIATVLGKPLSVTAIAFAMIPLNAIANYVFAFGKLGLPALGLTGLGIASTLIFWLSFLTTVALFAFAPDFKTKRLFLYLRQFNAAIFSQILKLSLPLMVQYGSELLLFAVAALLMGYWGTNYLVAHEIAISMLDITIMIPWGISYAAAIRVAQALGQNQPGDASRAGIINYFDGCNIYHHRSLGFLVLSPANRSTIPRCFQPRKFRNSAPVRKIIPDCCCVSNFL